MSAASSPGGNVLLQFGDLDVEPQLKENILALGYSTATPVQTETMPPLLAGEDVVAKARTGTGKTLAFLIPTLQRLMTSKRQNEGHIRALVLSPTRELAAQIAEAAASLVKGSGIKTACVFGGTSMARDRRMLSGSIDLLVATPGRLADHIENEGLAPRLRGLQTLILDEGDRLLDQGFSKQVSQIVAVLPRERQSLCFSATMPRELASVLQKTLKRGHTVVDCVGELADAETASKVTQRLVCAEMNAVYGLAALAVRREILEAGGLGKVVVFCPTANQAQFTSELFNSMGVENDPLHSRKSQAYRTRVSNAFRDCKQGVIVASDVAARGVDYPGVSLVVQMGAPENREQYVHRTGRTGRAGKAGQALLFLSEWEERSAMQMLAGLPIEKAECSVDEQQSALAQASASVASVELATRERAYQAWLGYYKAKMKALKWKPETLVGMANELALGALGLPEVPTLQAKTVGMMGLRGTPGLVVAKGPSGGGGGGRGGGRGGGAGGGRGRGGGRGGRGAGTGRDGSGGGRGATRAYSSRAAGRGDGRGRGGGPGPSGSRARAGRGASTLRY